MEKTIDLYICFLSVLSNIHENLGIIYSLIRFFIKRFRRQIKRRGPLYPESLIELQVHCALSPLLFMN
jgi:hypothetical protein